LGFPDLVIDRRNSTNKIILIVGANGSGKSLLMQYWTPFSNERTNNRKKPITTPGMEAMKEVDIHSTDDNKIDLTYKCRIIYGARSTVCYLAVVDNNTGVERELNPTGLVSSYEELLYSILKIDKNYTTVGYLSPQLTSFVAMNPGARYEIISEWMPNIEEYVVGYRNVTKKINATNRQIKMMENEIGDVSIESVKQNMIILQNRIVKIETDLDTLKTNRMKLSVQADSLTKISRSEIHNKIFEINSVSRSLKEQHTKLMSIIDKGRKYYGSDGMEHLQNDIKDLEKSILTVDHQLETTLNSINESKVQLKEKEYSLGLLNVSSYDLDIDDLLRAMEEKVDGVKKVMEKYSNQYTFLQHLDDSLSNESFQAIYNILDQVNDKCRAVLQYVSIEKIDNLTEIISMNEEQYKLLTEKIMRLEKETNTTLEAITSLKGTPLNPEILNLVPEICNIDCGVINKIKQLLNPDTEILSLQNKLAEVYKEREVVAGEIENVTASNNDIYTATSMIADVDQMLMKNKNFIIKLPEQLVDILTKNVGHIMTNINYVLSSIEHIKEYISVRDQYKTYNEELQKLKVKETTVRYAINMNDEMKKITSKMSELETSRVQIVEKGKVLNDELIALNELKDSISSINEMIRKYNENVAKHNVAISEVEGLCTDWYRNAVISRSIVQYDMRIQELSNEHLKGKMEYDSLNSILISKGTLIESRNKLIELIKSLTFLQEACSPSSGVPAFFIANFLKKVHTLSNKYLQTLNGNSLTISRFELGKSVREFPIEIEKDDGTIISDASMTSEGQIALITLAISMALISSIVQNDGYNVLRFDELDGCLDSIRRGLFAGLVQDKMEEIGSRQALIVSHNNEFRNIPADIIMMPGADVDSDMLANKKVLLDLSKVPIDQF